MLDAVEKHIAITAWRRPEVTRRTLEALAGHNDLDLSRWHLWYGLDGGHDPETRAALEEFGAGRLVHFRQHQGIEALTEALVLAVAEEGQPGDWLLLLQNDWKCVRPIPVGAIREALGWGRADKAWVWLVGLRKSATWVQDALHRGYRKPCPPMRWELRWTGIAGQNNQRLSGRAVEAAEPVLWSVTPGYWGTPPSVARLGQLRRVLAAGRPGQGKEPFWYRRESHCRGYHTAWFVNGVFRHVGGRGWKQRGGKL